MKQGFISGAVLFIDRPNLHMLLELYNHTVPLFCHALALSNFTFQPNHQRPKSSMSQDTARKVAIGLFTIWLWKTGFEEYVKWFSWLLRIKIIYARICCQIREVCWLENFEMIFHSMFWKQLIHCNEILTNWLKKYRMCTLGKNFAHVLIKVLLQYRKQVTGLATNSMKCIKVIQHFFLKAFMYWKLCLETSFPLNAFWIYMKKPISRRITYMQAKQHYVITGWSKMTYSNAFTSQEANGLQIFFKIIHSTGLCDDYISNLARRATPTTGGLLRNISHNFLQNI